MLKIKVSSKRQATFPKRVCESLGVGPGDEVLLDRRLEADGEVWVLRSAKETRRPWLGCLKAYAKGKEHEMTKVRESIARGRGGSGA
jgi:bifunctional DNA-binding transcriptional regulator/antitoxin component of YhaV-PrlF toxin-antitoxin module